MYNSHPFDIRLSGITAFLLACLIFMRCQPFYLWPIEDVLRPTCSALIFLICLLNFEYNKTNCWILCLLMASYIWATVFVDHSGFITIFNFIALAFIPVIKKQLIYDTYKIFRLIFVIFLTLSLMNYFFVQIGLGTIPNMIEPLNDLKNYKYLQYPFFVTTQFGGQRFMSVFDEPGALGTIAGLILVAEKFNFKKKANLIILLAGILSLSFYFYITLLLGLVLFSKNTKSKKYLIAALVVFILVTYNNDFFYQIIWSRFEWDAENGTFAGNNRTTGTFDNLYESIKWTPLMLTGLGSRAVADYSGSASLTFVIAKHGLIFCLLNIGAFFILSTREIKNRQSLLMFITFFVATLYQRPGFYSPHTIFLYSMVIYMFGSSNNTNINQIS